MPAQLLAQEPTTMDSFFSIDQYYSSDEGEPKLPLEHFPVQFETIEQESFDLISSSPELQATQIESVSANSSTSSNASASPSETQSWQPKRTRKRHDEIHRPFRCGWDGCDKAYGRLNHLNTHVAIHRHGPRRTGMDFPTASRKRSIRMANAEQQMGYQLLPSNASTSSSSSDTSSDDAPSNKEEPFIFTGNQEWSTAVFTQQSEKNDAPIQLDRYSFLAVQKTRLEHGRNEALNRLKSLEHERNTMAQELNQLDRMLDTSRELFAREQQSLDATMEELSQWRYPQAITTAPTGNVWY